MNVERNTDGAEEEEGKTSENSREKQSKVRSWEEESNKTAGERRKRAQKIIK